MYRFWRYTGYWVGALIAGLVADALGYGGAIAIVGALTAASGLWVVADMPSRLAATLGDGDVGEPQPAGPGGDVGARREQVA